MNNPARLANPNKTIKIKIFEKRLEDRTSENNFSNAPETKLGKYSKSP